MDRVQKALIENMKRFRKALGYSQMRMAELCDLSTSFIAEIETGKKFPSSGSIERIATALALRPYQLFLDGDERQKKDTPQAIGKASRELKAKLGKLIDETAMKLISELNQ
jgi:transcriptional regulator with XRE-family HTH domain